MADTSVPEHENTARETVRMKDRQKRKVDWVHVIEKTCCFYAVFLLHLGKLRQSNVILFESCEWMGVVWAREQGNKVGLKRDKEWLKVELCIHVIIAKKHSAFLCPEYSGNSTTRVNLCVQ